MKGIFFVLLLFSSCLKSQIDSAQAIPLVGVSFGGQYPGADMVKRYGPNLKIGGSFMMKSKKNWILGIESYYMFGRNVKENVLVQLQTPEGYIVDNEGYPADVRLTERGITAQLLLGKVIPVGGSNPNSGLIFILGLGYMQHKIHIYDAQTRVAAVQGDLKQGYDRLTAGFCTSQFLGYMFLSSNRLLNFYLGADCYQGFTQSIRKFNYDTGKPDTEPRLDVLTGFRVGWILPLYKKQPNDYYFD